MKYNGYKNHETYIIGLYINNHGEALDYLCHDCMAIFDTLLSRANSKSYDELLLETKLRLADSIFEFIKTEISLVGNEINEKEYPIY